MTAPGAPVDPNAARHAESAKKLVMWSHILGWGGIGTMFVLGPALGIVARSGSIGGVVAGIGLVSAVVGAVLGQVGRGMQGRVI